MTNEPSTSRSRSVHAEVPTAVPRPDTDPADVDATVVPVGTFAAGQSEDGRYVAVTAAAQGTYAAGQAEADEATPPEAQPSRAD